MNSIFLLCVLCYFLCVLCGYVVNKIEMGDTTHSVTIVRAGPEAEKFIVNDETFKALVEKQWRKVKYESETKKWR